MVQHATTLGADRKCRPGRVRDELLLIAGRLARDGETQLKQSPENPERFRPFIGPVANTDTKLLIYGLFRKGRVLAQDGVRSAERQGLQIAGGRARFNGPEDHHRTRHIVNGAARRQQKAPNQEVLAGLVERVTFHNADNGFCVLRIKARGHRDLVTVVGHAAIVSAGEWVTAAGEWVNDRTHGQQFKAGFMRTSEPSSIDGIEKYLGSGMIHGIGPVYARKMVKAFGEKVFDIIEAEPERLREVTGIGRVRAKRITDGRCCTARRKSLTSLCRSESHPAQ